MPSPIFSLEVWIKLYSKTNSHSKSDGVRGRKSGESKTQNDAEVLNSLDSMSPKHLGSILLQSILICLPLKNEGRPTLLRDVFSALITHRCQNPTTLKDAKMQTSPHFFLLCTACSWEQYFCGFDLVRKRKPFPGWIV